MAKKKFPMEAWALGTSFVLPEYNACRFLKYIDVDIDKEEQDLRSMTTRPCKEIIRDIFRDIPPDLKTRQIWMVV